MVLTENYNISTRKDTSDLKSAFRFKTLKYISIHVDRVASFRLPSSSATGRKYIRTSVKMCSYPGWRKNKNREEMQQHCHSAINKYARKTGVFNKNNIPVHFKPVNTLSQRLVHPKDKTLTTTNRVPKKHPTLSGISRQPRTQIGRKPHGLHRAR